VLQLPDGEIACAELCGVLTTNEWRFLFQTTGHNYVRKRTLTALNCELPYHVDTNVNFTTQICLDASAYTGSQTVFLTKTGPVSIVPQTGYGIMHNQAQVHGVSALTSGTRATLFVCRKINLHDDLKRWVVDEAAFYHRFLLSLELPLEDNDVLRWQTMKRILDIDTLQDEQGAIAFMRAVIKEFDAITLGTTPWSRDLAKATDAYLAFLARAVSQQQHQPSEEPEHPSVLVDFFWHTHMQHEFRYAADCLELFGVHVQHHATS
jgi:hypothetical protein